MAENQWTPFIIDLPRDLWVICEQIDSSMFMVRPVTANGRPRLSGRAQVAQLNCRVTNNKSLLVLTPLPPVVHHPHAAIGLLAALLMVGQTHDTRLSPCPHTLKLSPAPLFSLTRLLVLRMF